VVAACALLASCGDGAPPPEPTWFEDVARERGVDFQWRSGHVEKHYFPEIMGGGAALFDKDGDGDLDLYLVQGGAILDEPSERPGNQLFENDGTGRFSDRTEGSGAADRGYGMGVAIGDVDNDGRTDLYVTNVRANALLRNVDGARFEDITETSGTGDATWSASAAFFDYDRDGDLDLYVTNYLHWAVADELTCYSKPHPFDYCSPKAYDAPAPDTLYRNEGGGAFTDVSAEVGIRTVFGNGLGLVCSDFDDDGFEDVFVANDGVMNQLWMNRDGVRFEDLAIEFGCAVDQDGRQKAGMGTCAADVDGDGDEDLLVVNLSGEPDSFYRNDGNRFSDRTPIVGLTTASRNYTRFGMGFADFNNDGLLDLYEANGRVTRAPEASGPRPFDEVNLVFRGTATETSIRFEEVLPRGGTATELVATSRAAAFGDVDNDGGVDVVIVNRDGPAYLLRNVVADRGHWLMLRVLDEHGRDAIGAKVVLEVDGREIYRRVRSASSYCAANDPRVHVGLGQARRVERVTVTWVGGETGMFGPFEADRVVELRR